MLNILPECDTIGCEYSKNRGCTLPFVLKVTQGMKPLHITGCEISRNSKTKEITDLQLFVQEKDSEKRWIITFSPERGVRRYV